MRVNSTVKRYKLVVYLLMTVLFICIAGCPDDDDDSTPTQTPVPTPTATPVPSGEGIDAANDLIYWYIGGMPVYVGSLDLLGYSLQSTGSGNMLQGSLTVNEMLPGSSDSGFHEYYIVIDRDGDASNNYMSAGPTKGGDAAYIAQFLNGQWKMFLFTYTPQDGWRSQQTAATVSVDGMTLTMSIDGSELGIDPMSIPPFFGATWYRENGSDDVGDETETVTN